MCIMWLAVDNYLEVTEMKILDYRESILKCSIFHGVTEAELPDALSFLNAFDRTYRKNEMIFMIRRYGSGRDGRAELFGRRR